MTLTRQQLERLFSTERMSTYVARCDGNFDAAWTLTWLDDPNHEMSNRARDDIAAARARVRQKGKRASEGQTISELSFGFWRFLITKKLTGLWPDLATAFPYAPDREAGDCRGAHCAAARLP